MACAYASWKLRARHMGMIAQKELKPLTGYVHGGCSPIGMRTMLPVFIDETASLYDAVLVSGGAPGIDIELALDDLIALTGARLEDLTARSG